MHTETRGSKMFDCKGCGESQKVTAVVPGDHRPHLPTWARLGYCWDCFNSLFQAMAERFQAKPGMRFEEESDASETISRPPADGPF